MKKFLLIIILIIIIIVVSTMFYINAHSSEIVSNFLSKQMRTHVVVESSSLQLRGITLKNVRILNPAGASMPDALNIERVDVTFAPTSLWKETILIHQIKLEHPQIDIEFYNLTGSDNNWKSIFDNIVPAATAQPKSKLPKKKKKVIIDDLIIDDLTILAKHKILGPTPLTLTPKDHIELHHLTEEKAIAYRSALDLIFRAILLPISKMSGMHDILQETRPSEDIPQNSLENISSQEYANTSNNNSNQPVDWSRFKEDLQNAAKNAKKFFNDLFH